MSPPEIEILGFQGQKMQFPSLGAGDISPFKKGSEFKTAKENIKF